MLFRSVFEQVIAERPLELSDDQAPKTFERARIFRARTRNRKLIEDQTAWWERFGHRRRVWFKDFVLGKIIQFRRAHAMNRSSVRVRAVIEKTAEVSTGLS